MRWRNWLSRPNPGLVSFAVILLIAAPLVQLQTGAAEGRPERNRPGPWNNDVLVYCVTGEGMVERLATFPRAGVPTVTRMKDGRLIAAHQHFPADSEADFDKVAVHFSSDEGRTWTPPEVIQLEGLPGGMRFPFDPTLVPLPDGRMRLYFTSLKGRRFDEDRPAIYSAISTNGLDYVFEPGVRFGIEGRPVIDCAVALHKGVFHLFAPDNGAVIDPEAARPAPGNGIGYHATSNDGLTFTRQHDVRIEGERRWLGNAQSDGTAIHFFGTGGPGGGWVATSNNGESWTVDDKFPSVRGADPGAVKLKDGSWLLAVTGPPRSRAGGEGPPPPRSPLMTALDVNDDGVIDEAEIESAKVRLQRLDRNGDGKLTPDEIRPERPEGRRPPNQPPRPF